MFKHVHHVHYVVHNRDEMVAYMERNFGLKPESLNQDNEHGMKNAMYSAGQTVIDFVEPTKPDTDMARYLQNNGPGVFHVAWAVDNVRQLAQDLAAKGNRLMTGGNTTDGITTSPHGGYLSTNIQLEDSLGIWFSLVEA